MTFFEKLENRILSEKTYLCVGLDPVWSKIPKHIPRTQFGLYEFLAKIVDYTSDHAAVFKPNFAYFESLGVPGMEVLLELIQKMHIVFYNLNYHYNNLYHHLLLST